MAKKRSEPKELKLADAARILQTVDKGVLIRSVLEWAKDDKVLRERLVLFAARQTDDGSRVATVQRALEKAIRVRGYVSYHEARRWAKGVAEATRSVEELLADGTGPAVIELCEFGLLLLVEAVQTVDDSAGHFQSLRDGLEELHFTACAEIRPDPAQLAERLFRLELEGEFDLFYAAVKRYAEVLGEEGLQAYQELANAVWQQVPVRTSEDGGRWAEHRRITSIMKTLAEVRGDIDQLVAVMSRDLSLAYYYLQIAEVYQRAGRHDEALAWAERGLKAFPKGTDVRLRTFAAEEYHRRGRHGEAVEVMWAEFLGRPFAEEYQLLRRHAERASAWPEWRERALGEIRRRLAADGEDKRPRLRSSWDRQDRSVLVEIFLEEGNTEEAWKEAQEGGCSDGLWLRLALAREKEHPEDAAQIYWKHGARVVSSGRYEDSVKLLVKAAAVMKRLGRSAEFVRDLELLRAQYKARRNFVREIENRRADLYLS